MNLSNDGIDKKLEDDQYTSNIPNKRSRESFHSLLKEVMSFWFYLVIFMGIPVIIFYFVNDMSFDNSEFWFHIAWYPLAIIFVVFWIKIKQKDNLGHYLKFRPRTPQKKDRWFYITYCVFFCLILTGWIVFLILGNQWAYIDYPIDLIIVGLVHSCIGAPLVEEFLFRGYWYTRSESVWEKDGWYFTWNLHKKKKDSNSISIEKFMKFEITYAALFSSLLFGLWHLNPIQAVYTFFGGLIFVKTMREWGNTLIMPIVLHASWNFMAQILVITKFPVFDRILETIINLI